MKSYFRTCERISGSFGALVFEGSARRSDAPDASGEHRRGDATPQWSKDGAPQRAGALLGCDCVARRSRTTAGTPHSSAPCLAPKSPPANHSLILSQVLSPSKWFACWRMMGLLGCLLIVCGTAGAAHRITLSDGRVLTGEIAQINQEGIFFNVFSNGEDLNKQLSVSISEIQRLEILPSGAEMEALKRHVLTVTEKIEKLESHIQRLETVNRKLKGDLARQKSMMGTSDKDQTYYGEVTMKNSYSMKGMILEYEDAVVITSESGDFMVGREEVETVTRMTEEETDAYLKSSTRAEITSSIQDGTITHGVGSAKEKQADKLIWKKVNQYFFGQKIRSANVAKGNIATFNGLLDISQYVEEKALSLSYFHKDAWFTEDSLNATADELLRIPKAQSTAFTYKFGVWLAYQRGQGRTPDLSVLEEAQEKLLSLLE